MLCIQIKFLSVLSKMLGVMGIMSKLHGNFYIISFQTIVFEDMSQSHAHDNLQILYYWTSAAYCEELLEQHIATLCTQII
jgi:hypothetical protein